jgi:hypothetical protein
MALVTFPRLACRNLTLNLVTGARYGVRDLVYFYYYHALSKSPRRMPVYVDWIKSIKDV